MSAHADRLLQLLENERVYQIQQAVEKERQRNQLAAAAASEKGRQQGRDGVIFEAAKYLTDQGNDEKAVVSTLKGMFSLSTQQAESYYRRATTSA